jgi:hypothetical protein
VCVGVGACAHPSVCMRMHMYVCVHACIHTCKNAYMDIYELNVFYMFCMV